MAAHNLESVIPRAVEAGEEMALVVRGAIGPHGGAMLSQSTSHMLITRSGGTMLHSVFSPTADPVLTLLLGSASYLHTTIGDGVKTYVMFLNALLKQLPLRSTPLLVNKLLTAQTALQNCFTSRRCQCVLTDRILQNVIVTFFCTRFTQTVAEKLSHLVSEWVSKLRSLSEISIYVCNFSTLCLKFSPSPLFLSSVQNGFLVKGISNKRLPMNGERCAIKVYYYPLENKPNGCEIETDILNVIEEYCDDQINLLITNVTLQDRALFLLNVREIYTIHSVCTDSTKFLYEHSLSGNKLLLDYRYVNECLWISLENVSQVLLRAPNAAISTEYSNGILDCLKMLTYSFKESYCVINAGGRFEYSLARRLFESTKGIIPRIPPVRCRKDLLAWKTSPEDFELLKHIDHSFLETIDFEVAEIISRALLSINVVEITDNEFFEPLELRLAVILKALNTLLTVSKLGGAIIKPKKGRLV